VHLVGYIIRIYDDIWSHERQILCNHLYIVPQYVFKVACALSMAKPRPKRVVIINKIDYSCV
jgi:hypothetical protein